MRKLKKIKTSKDETLKAQLTRSLADYQNLVNRVERERREVTLRANKELVGNFLGVLDNLSFCQKHLRDEGLGVAISEFERVLEEAGVTRIEVKKGDRFDEEICEAGEVVDPSAGSGGDTGTVAEITREGYKWSDGTVLRPVRVKVYSHLI